MSALRFDDMYAGGIAVDSYRMFRRLRDAGVIPLHVRFQVCVPGSVSGIEPYFPQPADWPVVGAAYEEETRADIARTLEKIPLTELHSPEDQAIREAVRRQVDTDLDVVTDVEFRPYMFTGSAESREDSGR